MEKNKVKPVERLEELPYYEQDSGANITYQFAVKPGAMGLLSAGRVCAKGPTTKAMDAHLGWDQIYIVLKGAGTVVVGRRKYPVSAGSLVRIPRRTRHGVMLRRGERIEYLYINAFENKRALRGLVRTLK